MASLIQESATSDAPAPELAGHSYWALVWSQFRRDRLAIAGLALIVLLFFVAIFAPLIASGKPILLKSEGQWSSPLLRDVFAPIESPESFLERFYNFCLVYSLAALLLLLPMGLMFRRKWTAMYIAAALLLLACLFPFFAVQGRLDKTDYRELAGNDGIKAVFAPLPYGPYEQAAPAYEPPSVRHPLGTDRVGRDVLSRIIHGSRVSLSVGFLAVGVAVAIGIFVGSISAYAGGRTDLILQRVVEVVICFPVFLLILTIMAFIEQRSIFNVMLVIGLTGWTGVARLVRGQMLQEKSKDYVTAAQALGAGASRTIFRHLLPNSIAPVLVAATFGVAGAILTETGLSFLGFGVRPPTASWGELLNQAMSRPTGYWWLTTFPGVMIFMTVTVYNLVGEGLRDALDPRLKI